MTALARVGREIRVRGRVQGVGFRPFVWRLANDAGLAGQVCNDGEGVRIQVWGTQADIATFLGGLHRDPPPLARIDTAEGSALSGPPPGDGFVIAPSRGGPVSTEIAPDAATCGACLAEVRDRNDRRHNYAFTNCTHCGPRLSIVQGIPYDRAQTSMRAFRMCDDCNREYQDPGDRRFHAQPNACPVCGPRLWLEDRAGRVSCADPVAETARRLMAGGIAAIKGIGGFHLACDATDAAAVAALRKRKHRPAKPLALMAGDLRQIRRFCHLTRTEARLLKSPAAPIVLLSRRDAAALPGVAPGQPRIGMMLPHSPLHHLLMAALDRPLVMTSGNLSDAPQVTRNADALRSLADIADVWLLHDRDIANRLDDSVARVVLGAPTVIRRGRGMAPEATPLAAGFANAPPILAMGAELKSTFCLLDGQRAILSPHIGDLKQAGSYADYRQKIALFRDLYRFTPAIVAVDRHPDYLSARWGASLADAAGAEAVGVFHHHAHLASCLAEHRVPTDDDLTVGVILDGLGMGEGGELWGAEVLLGGYAGFARKARFLPVSLPGGEQAMREPWRNTVAHLIAAFGPDWRTQPAASGLFRVLDGKPVGPIEQMIEKRLNAPVASSAGRLFDAVAGALGLCADRQSYEGQAAMELEAIALPHLSTAGAYPVGRASGAGVATLSWAPLWASLAGDLRRGVDPGAMSARFHNGLAAALAEIAMRIAGEAGAARAALSGGVMQNRALLTTLYRRLTDQGLSVLVHRTVPANDGGIALGQAAVVAARHGR